LTGSDIETKNLNEMILNLSKKTAGASCADISNICNQTKIICVQSNRQIINETDINIALEQILIGFEKPSRSMNNDEKKRVSVHEAGHALIAYILKSSNHPIKISIIPRGENALGYTQQEPDDLKLWTFDKIIAEVAVLMGGRASEEIMLNSLSSGSSDDLDKINRLMKNLFYRFGGYKNASDFMIIDKDTSSTRLYEQEEEIKKHNMIIYKKVLELISNNKESIDKLSDYLLEYETMDSTIIDNMLDNSIKNTITIEID
jgi:cell division protease FtsH